jgi:endoglucanase
LSRCCGEWTAFAARYRGRPNRELSFNLLNEPKDVADGDYIRVCAALAEAIRREDPDRLILCDGNECGTRPLEGLIQLKVAQGTRGYLPFYLTHYRAPWVPGSDQFETPLWPVPGRFDAEWHWRECVEPWRKLEAKGVGIMVGEWGVYNRTPHEVVLRFMEDVLLNWEKAGWGWALWNFSGDFGPLDSRRSDVRYEDFRGRFLDRKMLDILQKY